MCKYGNTHSSQDIPAGVAQIKLSTPKLGLMKNICQISKNVLKTSKLMAHKKYTSLDVIAYF